MNAVLDKRHQMGERAQLVRVIKLKHKGINEQYINTKF